MISSIGQTQVNTAFRAKIPTTNTSHIKCPAIPDSFVPSPRRALMNPEELSVDVFLPNKNAFEKLFSSLVATKSRLEEFKTPLAEKYEQVVYKKPLGSIAEEKPMPESSFSVREEARNYFENLDDDANGYAAESIDKYA